MKWKYADYPEYIKAAEERYRKYNATLERLAEYEKNGSEQRNTKPTAINR